MDLTSTTEIKQLDPKDVFGSTGMLALQCEQIWEDAKKVTFPPEYKKVKNIILCGMGGSAYGAYVIPNLFHNSLSLPIVVNSDYHLPAWVDSLTLVILASYSGSTEESLSCAQEALAKKAKVTGITTGGRLGDFLRANNFPGLLFNPQHNPSTQPRLATGYMVLGCAALLAHLGLAPLTDDIVKQAITDLKSVQENIQARAIETAKQLQGTIPVIFAAEILNGNAHIFRNQLNETAKTFSAFSELPELNHHLMEGLKNPPDKKLTVVLLNSSFYSLALEKRMRLTRDVVGKNNITSLSFDALGSNEFSHVLTTLSYGGYVAVYLALLYGLDPSLIPWVDYFKAQLVSSS